MSIADIFTITELFLVCWSTGSEQWPIIVETMDMMLGHFLLLFYILFYYFYFLLILRKPIFQETSTKINTKNCQCYCKNKLTTILLILLSTLLPTIEVKSKFSQLCSETTRLQLSFEHLDIISVQLSIRV